MTTPEPELSDDPLPVTLQLCERCGGEGRIIRMAVGGWDEPREDDCGECRACCGTGYELIETEEADEEEIMSSGR